MLTDPCPCDRGLAYEVCCAPYHRGEQLPETALALMRSRYSAYCRGQVDYLIQTTHRDNPGYCRNTPAWRRELEAYCRAVQFNQLVILEDLPGDTTASVTFRAVLTHQGEPMAMIEKSRFVKTGGRWYYRSGESLPAT